jgi:hypothetical protein
VSSSLPKGRQGRGCADAPNRQGCEKAAWRNLQPGFRSSPRSRPRQRTITRLEDEVLSFLSVVQMICRTSGGKANSGMTCSRARRQAPRPIALA